MTEWLPPSLLFFVGALLLPLRPGKARKIAIIAVPVLAFWLITTLAPGTGWHYQLFGHDLTLLRVDRLSKAFGYVFTINAFAAFLFAAHLRGWYEHVAALFYIGASLGAVFAGDLISLYLFWEIMAVASTFLILARESQPGGFSLCHDSPARRSVLFGGDPVASARRRLGRV